jgi:nucleotide-binding universal stress UspA family protein
MPMCARRSPSDARPMIESNNNNHDVLPSGEPLRTIGAAFDGSPESRAALQWAADLAERSDASVRILSVHEPLVSPVPGFHGIPMVAEDQALRDHLGRQLEAAASDLRHRGVAVETSLVTGDAVRVLVQESSELDVLVMGSRGYGRTRALLAGSVSRALVKRAACPVVVLPPGVAPETVDRETTAEHAVPR